MPNILTWGIRQKIVGLDWGFIKGSALLSVGTALARALGLAFSLVLAGAFSPGDYGSIQYSLMLALFFSIATQPFGQHVLARFIAKHKNDPQELTRILTNSWIVLAALFLLTLLIIIPILISIHALSIGILTVFLGTTVFYAYWGLSRGFLAPYRLTLVFLASNLVQLVFTLIFIYGLNVRSPEAALIIYGLSYFVPLAFAQYVLPLPVSFWVSAISAEIIKKLMRFSGAIWLSHAAFMLSTSAHIFFLKWFLGTEAVGVYSVASTMTIVFGFIPLAVSTLVLPEVTNMSRDKCIQLLKKALALSIFINLVGLIIYILMVRWFVQTMFGQAYVVSLPVYIVIALSAIILGAHGIVTAVLFGVGRPIYDTISRVAGLAVLIFACWFLIPIYGLSGAAMANLLSSISLFVPLAIIGLIDSKKRASHAPV